MIILLSSVILKFFKPNTPKESNRKIEFLGWISNMLHQCLSGLSDLWAFKIRKPYLFYLFFINLFKLMNLTIRFSRKILTNFLRCLFWLFLIVLSINLWFPFCHSFWLIRFLWMLIYFLHMPTHNLSFSIYPLFTHSLFYRFLSWTLISCRKLEHILYLIFFTSFKFSCNSFYLSQGLVVIFPSKIF